MPYDLTTLMLAEKLKQVNKEDLQKVEIFVEANGGFSGGTLASLLGMIDRSQLRLSETKVNLTDYYTLPGSQDPTDCSS